MRRVKDIKKLLVLYVVIVLAGLFMIVNNNAIEVRAVQYQTPIGTVLSNQAVNSDGSNRTVPNGLTNIGQWFNTPNINGSDANSARVYGANTETNKGPADVVSLTEYNKFGSDSKVGAIWSKESPSTDKDRNYIDINKRQTMSMWMYFGGAHIRNNQVNAGDGMAFVLQNSNEKDSAFTAIPSTGNIGESLGVWGEPLSATEETSQLASDAIQNSWAMEFDTYLNNPDGAGSYDTIFDKDFTANNHIATNYPGEPSTYRKTVNGPIMNHDNRISANLVTDSWHHITLTWYPVDPTTHLAKVKLAFDDRNIAGDKLTGTEKDFTVDTTKFHLGTSNELYWGFTGSTGSSSENNLVIFESIPSIVEGDADATIIDESSDRVITDPTSTDANANVVHDNDRVSVNYNLKYLSGSQAWKDIEAKINLPQNIDYDSASLTYTDSDGKESQETISEFDKNSKQLTHKLAQVLGSTGAKSATIKVSGIAKAESTNTTTNVASEHSSFDGSNLQKDVMTQAFVIKQAKTITLSKINSPIVISAGQTANLKGTINDSTGAVIPSNYVIHAKVNDSNVKIKQSVDANPFTFSLSSVKGANGAGNDLNDGENTISVYVEDKTTHDVSNTMTYQVNISGGLQVTANEESSFQTVQSVAGNKIIHRADDWSVEISDSLDSGTNWYLSAEATQLKSGDQTWAGGIVYVDDNGNEKPLTDQDTNIESGVKSKTGVEKIDIDSGWKKDTGILLRQTAAESRGKYTGTITWTAKDTL